MILTSDNGIPDAAARWELSGAGLDNVSLARRPVQPPGPGELLLRVDACGICFSDIKILNLGDQHPRLLGRDLRQEPVVMGHETAMTVVAVGSDLRDRFTPGSRFIIQADVYYRGENLAFGYRLPGGYSQYQTVGEAVLAGDEGCYLLPVAAHLGYSQAALCEPWACVEAAYAFQPRGEPKEAGAFFRVPGDAEPAEAAARAQAEYPGGVDDLLVEGVPSPALAEALLGLLRPGGVLAVRSAEVPPGIAQVDVGSIHYRGHWLTAATADPVRYSWGPRTCELVGGGSALFIGAGGPLGQMHLQRALSLPVPPCRIVVTQRGEARLRMLEERFAAEAARRNVQWTLLDERALGERVYDAALAATDGRGFDDVVTIVPDLNTISRVLPLLGEGGGLNIFAGVPVGSRAAIDLQRVFRDGVRLWGTSGSTIRDLTRIVERVESGALDTDPVVAAVGGIGAVAEGLAAVRDARFLGKTIIYPQLENLPLTAVADLAAQHLSIGERLTNGRLWNREAEAELLRIYVCAT